MAESRRWKEEGQTRLKRAIAAISIDLTGAAPDEILLVLRGPFLKRLAEKFDATRPANSMKLATLAPAA